MRQPLYEGLAGAVPFIVDRTKEFVSESRHGLTVTKIPGRFSICDSVNGNGRKYPEPVWVKNLAEGSPLKTAIAKNAAFGLLEHPANGQITLNSPICILVTDARLQPVQGKALKEVVGEIMVLGTAEGQKLSALIDAGYNPLVSSRGFGSVIKDNEGIDIVQDDFICEGWDVVMKPSFETAELWPERSEAKEEAKKDEKKPEAALAESTTTKDEPKAQAPTILKETAVPSPAPAPAVASAPKPTTETNMDINTIKSRIGAFRTEKVPSDPQRFAEGLNEMATLHQEIANFVAEDTKRSWQGQQLHDSLKTVESAWNESALAPTRTASKLTESFRKALRVTKVLGETACAFKKRLTESTKRLTEASALIEEITKRGQAWVAVADKRKGQNEELEHKLNVACEALEIMAGRYHEDVTELGRRVIVLEFAEKAQTEPIQKLLKEATHPKHILAVREQLEGKKPAGEKKDESKKDESKKDEAKPAPLAEAKKDAEPVISEARPLVPSVRTVTESVDMAKRLSAASAK